MRFKFLKMGQILHMNMEARGFLPSWSNKLKLSYSLYITCVGNFSACIITNIVNI